MDNEIIKTMGSCLSDSPPCTACKYDGNTFTVDECMGELMKDALDLINRQKAEIERLQKANESFACLGMLYSEIKTEARKEFAEKLCDLAAKVTLGGKYEYRVVTVESIKYILAEMESERE